MNNGRCENIKVIDPIPVPHNTLTAIQFEVTGDE